MGLVSFSRSRSIGASAAGQKLFSMLILPSRSLDHSTALFGQKPRRARSPIGCGTGLVGGMGMLLYLLADMVSSYNSSGRITSSSTIARTRLKARRPKGVALRRWSWTAKRRLPT